MRLTIEQVQLVKKTVEIILNVPSHIWLFGSRVNDDKKRGGVLIYSSKHSLYAQIVLKRYAVYMVN